MTNYYLGIAQNRVNPAKYNGWDGALQGCINDVMGLGEVCRKRSYKTKIFADAGTIINNVIAETLALAKAAKPGETVIIHSSGHGSQILDQSGDEADRRDETACHYDGELSDDDWARVLAQFAPGVNVVLITDRCHSATAARAAMTTTSAIRSKSKPAALRLTRAAYHKAAPNAVLSKLPVRFERNQIVIPATLLVFSACLDSETAGDTATNGVFTGAILKSVAKAPPTWSALHAEVKRLCGRKQTPTLEVIGGNEQSRARLLASVPFGK